MQSKKKIRIQIFLCIKSLVFESVKSLEFTQSYVAAGHPRPRWLDLLFANERYSSGAQIGGWVFFGEAFGRCVCNANGFC